MKATKIAKKGKKGIIGSGGMISIDDESIRPFQTNKKGGRTENNTLEDQMMLTGGSD